MASAKILIPTNYHETFKWKRIDTIIKGDEENIVFSAKNIEVPKHWSQNAADILTSKYCRKTGVPLELEVVPEDNIPNWLCVSVRKDDCKKFGMEVSAKQVFHRLAGFWTYWGWKANHFKNEAEAISFYKDIFYCLYHQIAAPNSPQWFNAGLHWAYGITHNNDDADYYVTDSITGKITKTNENYERPSLHACYITKIKDNLVGKDGIMEHIKLEAKIFKNGSGSGTNYSQLRGIDEKLSGGGRSSGLMSFLKIPDRSAGAIQSGGTTRRAARNCGIDADHPEILEFIKWKSKEEYKVCSMITGSRIMKRLFTKILNSKSQEETDSYILECKHLGIPESYVTKILYTKNQNIKTIYMEEFDADYQGEAYNTVSGQNANNNIMVGDDLMAKFAMGNKNSETHALTSRKTKEVVAELNTEELFDTIGYASWDSADPGLAYKDTINAWNTCPNDGTIEGSNPCNEYWFIVNTSCNLASLNLLTFAANKSWKGAAHGIHSNIDTSKKDNTWTFDYESFHYIVKLWTRVLEISVAACQQPSYDIAKSTWDYRPLGLGYTNLGSLLMRMAIPYDSEEGRSVCSFITALLQAGAIETSAEMADQLGQFNRYKANKEHILEVIANHANSVTGSNGYSSRLNILPQKPNWDTLPYNLKEGMNFLKTAWATVFEKVSTFGLRNAYWSNLAPTGTISLLMDCDTTGIEPDYSIFKFKKLAGGGNMEIINQSVKPALKTLGYSDSEIKTIITYINETKTIEGVPVLEDEHLAIFDCAVISNRRFIKPEGHIKMVAAAQPFLSGAVSKTINVPITISIHDIKELFLLAHSLMIKSITIYRDQSKLSQPLMAAGTVESIYQRVGKSNDVTGALAPRVRRMLSDKRRGYTQRVKVGGKKMFLHTGEYPDGTLGEIFIDIDKEGAMLRSTLNALAIALSLGLQYGVPLTKFVDAFYGMRFEPLGPVIGDDNIKMANSILDYIARHLAINYLDRMDLANIMTISKNVDKPTEPTNAENQDIVFGMRCRKCNSERLIRSGICYICLNCNTTTECG